MEPTIDPDAAVRVARLTEELGFDSLWAGEHVVVPDPRRPPSPMAPGEPVGDPLITLAFIAAHTQRIRLATGVVVLPQRNPLILAKQLATLDVLSRGRLMFGFGVGFLAPELEAMGVSLASRGRMADEYLQAMVSLWTMAQPRYQGRFVAFSGVNAYPRPVQRPVPVVVGGHGDAAFRRAAMVGHGWFGFLLDPDGAARAVDALGAAAQEVGRPRGAPRLEVSVAPSLPLDPPTVARYADAGVDRLVLFPPKGLTVTELEGFLAAHAPARLVPA
jgi:probable F420-dependent oxidoreductase